MEEALQEAAGGGLENTIPARELLPGEDKEMNVFWIKERTEQSKEIHAISTCFMLFFIEKSQRFSKGLS